MNDAVANEIAFVKQLVADGAKNLLVLNVPDLGKTPEVMEGWPTAATRRRPPLDAEASQLSSEYNTALSSQLATSVPARSTCTWSTPTNLIDNAVANPAAYRADQRHIAGVERQLHQRQQRHARSDRPRDAGPVSVLGPLAPDRDRPSGDRRVGRGATQRHAAPGRRRIPQRTSR